MTEEERVREGCTNTHTHKFMVLNGYLIPWGSDHANPLFKGSEREKIDREQKKNMPREQGLLMFLEELESISIMNTVLSEKKSKGRPEDGELKDRKTEEMKI